MGSDKKGGPIACPACGKESLLLLRPKYEGFKKVGDIPTCASCGHEFIGDEPIPYVSKTVSIPGFLASDKREPPPRLLGESKELRFCLYCAEYIENPFTQRCIKHRREIQATDTCPDFQRKGIGDPKQRPSRPVP